MAKKATSSGKGGRVAKAAASAAPQDPAAQATVAAPATAQGMTDPSSDGAPVPLVEKAPAEGFGVISPPLVSSTEPVPPNPQPGASASKAVTSQAELQGDVQQQPQAESATPPAVLPVEAFTEDQDHPGIALAQTFQTGSGRPTGAVTQFYTPPPPNVRR